MLYHNNYYTKLLHLNINFFVKHYILFLSTIILRKVLLYAFHLKQGGVIRPHN